MIVHVRDKVLCFEFSSKFTMKSCLETFIMLYENKPYIENLGCYFPTTSALKWIRDTEGRVKNENQKTFMHHIKINSQKCVYVVAFVKGETNMKLHCLRHARFFIDYRYRSRVEHVWRNLDMRTKFQIAQALDSMGYPEHLWIDEFQAYITTEHKGFFGFQQDTKLLKLMLRL